MSTGPTASAPENSRSNPEAFTTGLAHVARRILLGAPRLDPSEREFLHDLSRTEERYAFKSLQRLLALSARCTRPEDSEAFPELLRTLIVAQRNERLNAMSAFELETQSQSETDIAQFAFVRNPCRTTKERVIDALRSQLARTKSALDAVIAA